jgi:hypothetical protein
MENAHACDRLLLSAFVALVLASATAKAQQPGWWDVPGGQWTTIPGTEIRVFEDGGRLKYWVENLSGGGKLVHLRDFQNGTDVVVEDTVPGDGNTDNLDIDIEGDDSAHAQ